ncbi:PREDICTED: protein ABSCISIC ACID-INSENSITIVE 5-like [Camelina sativa]|uniref:Protein ABSCISIC ACID-INSENSITIVE 5-like n=1 Tax=Camelina sativa TaxID=90675 RepID=A0ABM0ZK12_CAMSA|nr:PREDICTED: protein ABSCISIC ACID-INSENSITIVE 5-like [Camelina sativa]
MVLRETKMMSEREVESSTAQARQNGVGGGENHHPFSSLGRQSSIYSLTLDEFQHALCENGKNFGSMNMDEFLVSIWNAEENNNNQQAAASHSVPPNHNGFNNNNNGGESGVGVFGGGSTGNEGDNSNNNKRGIAKQPSLPRQGSLTLPAPLCRKTVDEVWSEIHRGGGGGGGGGDSNGRSSSSNNGQNNAQNGGETAARQPTFGEMTLEDFLVKAGVVREHPTNPKPNPNQSQNQNPSSVIPAAAQQQLYGVFQGTGDPTFPGQAMGVGDPSGYGKRAGGGGYQQAPPVQAGVCYGGGGGGFGAGGQQMGMVGPLSPVSSDGLGHGQVDNIGGQYGVDMGGLRGRKRVADGPVEKVVERRQRRMIKNRESAARSRARKQAYTVELEAELNQLKEENAQLKHALAELERKRKQQYFESLKTRAQPKLPKSNGRLRTLMRNPSCPL